MEHTHSTTDQPVRIPRLVWLAGGGLLIAIVAVVVFKVPFSTVAYIALFAVFLGSHFFMHGAHGGHDAHDQHADDSTSRAMTTAGTTELATATAAAPLEDQHARHSGGCC